MLLVTPAFGLDSAPQHKGNTSHHKAEEISEELDNLLHIKYVPDLQTMNPADETLSQVIPTILLGSEFHYTFSNLRRLILDHSRTARNGKPKVVEKFWGQSEELPIVTFDRPELIWTQNAAPVDAEYRKERYLKRDITAKCILEFIQRNRNVLKYNKKGNIVLDEEGRSQGQSPDDPRKVEMFQDLENKLQFVVPIDGALLEFDDVKEDQSLVYAITVNRTERRVIVSFRGSVTLTDWRTNARVWPVEMDLPGGAGDKFKNPVKVHAGFHDYLFGENKESRFSGGFHSKFEHITKVLEEIYAQHPEYADYALYVAGHSLGGALSQLFSFQLAVSDFCEKHGVPGPIRTISFASPQPGTSSFNDAFHALEKEGRLQHLRLSNSGDLVRKFCYFNATFSFIVTHCMTVSHHISPFFFAAVGLDFFAMGLGYTQTGVNVHIKERRRASVAYRNIKTFISQFSRSPAEKHSLSDYFANLFHQDDGQMINNHVLSKTIDALYQELVLGERGVIG